MLQDRKNLLKSGHIHFERVLSEKSNKLLDHVSLAFNFLAQNKIKFIQKPSFWKNMEAKYLPKKKISEFVKKRMQFISL